jgi:hypothetical protein
MKKAMLCDEKVWMDRWMVYDRGSSRFINTMGRNARDSAVKPICFGITL